VADIPPEQNPPKKLPAAFDNAQEQQKCLQDDVCKKLLEEASGSIYKILADNHNQGTGWTGSDGRIVTDYHVIANAKQIFAEDQNGKRHRLGKSVSIDKDNDLAVLDFAQAQPNLKPLELSKKQPQPGDPVYSLNHRAGQDLQMQIGKSNGIKTKEETERTLLGDDRFEAIKKRLLEQNPDYAQKLEKTLQRKFEVSSISTNHGSSGGPVFDSTGKVVSMVDEGRNGQSGVVYNTPAEIIARGINASPIGRAYYQSNMAYLANHGGTKELTHAGIYGGVSALTGRALLRETPSTSAYVVAGTLLLNQTVSDIYQLNKSGDNRDQIKYGLAVAADSTMAAGLATRIAARSPYLGLSILAGGAAMRLAADLIPNVLVYKEKE